MQPILKVYQGYYLILILCAFCSTMLQSQETISEKPNIVWLVSEDNARDWLHLYHPGGASMPNVEALAKHGIVFNQAFSNAPVCSVARSTIISGCYAPRVGAQYHRRAQLVPLPEGQEMFPYYLRKAGYYTSNNSKEDYNLIKSEEVWDASSREASYKNRKPGQPFFHVQNFGTTHEGRLHFPPKDLTDKPTLNDPSTITPFPYHPNNDIFRYTYARYYDLHEQLDKQIGAFLKELEAKGCWSIRSFFITVIMVAYYQEVKGTSMKVGYRSLWLFIYRKNGSICLPYRLGVTWMALFSLLIWDRQYSIWRG